MAQTPSQPSNFCSNCGQAVSPTPMVAGTAVAADNPAVQFCCRCGRQKNPDNTCSNNQCPFFGAIPNCG